MIRKAIIACAGALAILFVGVLVVYSQDNERATFIEYVEEQISSPSYQIKLNGLAGALSSDVSFDSITISDTDGVWLEILKPKLIWTRTALLRGRLVIDTLEAEQIKFIRKPLPEEGLPAPESGSLALPQLPVAIVLEKLDLPLVEFGPEIIGLASQVSVAGKIILDDGSLDLDLAINRLDDVGGELKAIAQYDGGAKTIFLDVDLNEPENGIIASLLNIPQKPPVRIRMEGDAPLSELDVVLAFDVASERILDGYVNFADVENGLRTTANLKGPLSKILPKGRRAFFGSQSDLTAELIFFNAGGFRLLNSKLSSGAVTLLASAEMTADGFLNALKVEGNLGNPSGERLQLPIGASQGSGLKSTIQSAKLDIYYDATSQNTWDGKFTLHKYANKDISFDNLSLDAFGTILTSDEDNSREISFDIDGLVSDIMSEDIALAQAVGEEIKLQFDGDWRSGSPIKISRFNIFGESYKLLADGSFLDRVFNGKIAVEADDLRSFASLSETNMNGAIKLAVNGDIRPFSGEFDLGVDGHGQDLKSGSEFVDQLLAGSTKLSGKIERGQDGLSFDQFLLENKQMNAAIDGLLSSKRASLSANAQIIDMKALEENSSGEAVLTLDLIGEQTPFNLDIVLGLREGRLVKQNVSDLALMFNGKLDGLNLFGAFSSKGYLAGQAAKFGGRLSVDAAGLNLSDFSAQIGGSKLEGSFARERTSGLMQSDFRIDSGNISALAALALTEASGALNGTFSLTPADNNSQTARGAFKASTLVVGGLKVASADIDFNAHDILNEPKIDAVVDAFGLVAGGVEASSLSAKIDNQGRLTKFELVSALAQNSTVINTFGRVNQVRGLTEVLIDEFKLTSNIANVTLASQSRITLQKDIIRIEPITLDIGGGSVEIVGSAGEQIDIDVIARSLPLNIANAVHAGFGASGTLGARAKISGSSTRPNVTFEINGQGITTRQVRALRLAPMDISGSGGFVDNVISLADFRIRNQQQLTINANGNIPVSTGGLDVNIDGTAPANIANIFLIGRGTQLGGIAQFSGKISGSLDTPIASGNVLLQDGIIIDPLSNIQINGMRVALKLKNSISADLTFSGNFASGGSVAASGNVGLSAQMPANLNIQLRSAKYSDGETFNTQINGDLLINGDLSASPLLSGNLNLGRTEIIVPESFSADASLVDVEHINADNKVQKTLERIEAVTPIKHSGQDRAVMRLQLNINAPNQIFVRGRGLDAELGGRLRLTGSLNNIVPLGSFNLRRGRLTLLGQRLDLDRGAITLAGDLDPVLNFVATTQTGDTLASVELQGTASNLRVTFSSNPELPEDEVLAKIIFGRNLADLSPAQILKLVSIAAELTGGNSPSLVDGLRKSTGLDDVDIVQDDQGNAAVKVGKYISDNVYLGVQAGKETEATINLDITDSLTARGSVGSDGNSKLGIFFEKDY